MSGMEFIVKSENIWEICTVSCYLTKVKFISVAVNLSYGLKGVHRPIVNTCSQTSTGTTVGEIYQ